MSKRSSDILYFLLEQSLYSVLAISSFYKYFKNFYNEVFSRYKDISKLFLLSPQIKAFLWRIYFRELICNIRETYIANLRCLEY